MVVDSNPLTTFDNDVEITGDLYVDGKIHGNDTGSPYIVYASQAGVPACDPSNPQAGPDGTAALQALCNLAQNGTTPLIIIIDIPILAANVSVYSNTTIEGLGSFSGSVESPNSQAPAGLWQKVIPASGPGMTNSCILKNAHWASPYQGGTITDHNITFRHLYLNGQRAYPANPGAPTSFSNANGQICSPIQMYGVNNLLVEDIFVYDPIAYAQHVANVFNAKFYNIGVCCPAALAAPGTLLDGGTACLQFCGPWDQVTIDGMYGTTGDDFLAFNMVDGNLSETNVSGEIGAAVFGGYNTVYYGSGGSTIVKNVRPYKCENAVRILYGSDPRHDGVNPAILSYISIENVVGDTVNGPLLAGSGTGFGSGSGGSVTYMEIKGWQVSQTSSVNAPLFGGLQLPAAQAIILKDFLFGSLSTGWQGHQVTPNGAIGQLLLDNFMIYDLGTDTNPNPMFLLTGSGNSVGVLVVRDCQWVRSTNSSNPMVSVQEATSVMRIENVVTSNLGNILSITGSGSGDIDTCGIKMFSQGSNPAINIGSGVTIPRMRSSNSDTTLLQGGGGTVTSLKTDGTEDA